jgi:P27 family predicted phage terminase small subunit
MSTGRRGPAPQPAAVKRAKGNPGHRPITDESEIEQDYTESHSEEMTSNDHSAMPVIEPPEWLNDDGLQVWDRLAPRLSLMRILQNIDADTFARYCFGFGRWVRLQRQIDNEGATYTSKSPHGEYVRIHPAVAMADRLDRTLMQFESNFALNPADRQRLFAARAAAAGIGAGRSDLFDQSKGAGVDNGKNDNAGSLAVSPIGILN